MLYMCRLGELVLKGKNRRAYEKKLLHHIRTHTPDECSVELRASRVYISLPESAGPEIARQVERGLSRVFGINGFASVDVVEKSLPAIESAAIRTAAGFRKPATFRVSARRADKSFPVSSPEIERRVGATVLDQVDGLSVDLRNHTDQITIEVRDRAYVYGPETKGIRGLPTGTSGRGLLLLSGGIDSPVAGFQMAGRGMIFDAVHFHSYPYTSQEAHEKAERLSSTLAAYIGSFRLFSVSLTETQLRIRRRARSREHTVLLRGCMMRLASSIARRTKALGLISGDSLGQVASQTLSNLRFTDSNADLPVYRPLIGLDKEDIVRRARSIGTFEISIEPFPDCCTLFAPSNPITNSSLSRMQYEMEQLEIDEILAQAIDDMRVIEILGPPYTTP